MHSSKNVITEVTNLILIVRTGQCTVKLNFPYSLKELLSASLIGQPTTSLGFFIRLFKECMQTMKDK